MTKQLMRLVVNGIEKEVFVRNADTLLYVLREKLHLTGAKNGCGNGDCGSCTILVNGVPFNACHLLAIEAMGLNITTIEGLMDPTVQNSFIDNWAIQCGYCTSGFILNAYALAETYPEADDAVIDEWLDSNICRCTGYQEIKEAVKTVLSMKKKMY